MALPIMTERQLLTLIETSPDFQEFMRTMIHSIFAPRLMTISTTAVTIDETHRGAILRFTSSSAITVVLPTNLDAGFLFTFLPYGGGTITFSGTTIGGSGSAGQYTSGSCLLLDTGEWLISGGA